MFRVLSSNTLNEKVYPQFNDAPHERPILTDAGLGRALLILSAVLALMSVAYLLTYL